ncbi:uncharacterized protein LOC126758163 [Bactrocera neohumeralis]|uniref:uncharacterized protein LOC126758163 n=1 Tax=Bactrocera neohumeralis TaxID=98809 RepID=UPI00216629AB|nr:uncharacterized protein LOC126758163 [Bactrocera neohumeralis]
MGLSLDDVEDNKAKPNGDKGIRYPLQQRQNIFKTLSHQRDVSPTPPIRRMNSWVANTEGVDPFDVYKPRERRMSPDLPPPPPKGILRPSTRQLSPDIYKRRYLPEPSSHLSYEMRSRLERAPDPHASMGIFSNPIKSSSSSSGYRIVVSNLHSSVTQSDIQELFEDIGPLYDSRLVRPGVAEVIYKSLTDAEKAVDTYHNRQLDGQPMKCLLVNPRASNKPTAPAIPTKQPLKIDIDTLRKVFLRRQYVQMTMGGEPMKCLLVNARGSNKPPLQQYQQV